MIRRLWPKVTEQEGNGSNPVYGYSCDLEVKVTEGVMDLLSEGRVSVVIGRRENVGLVKLLDDIVFRMTLGEICRIQLNADELAFYGLSQNGVTMQLHLVDMWAPLWEMSAVQRFEKAKEAKMTGTSLYKEGNLTSAFDKFSLAAKILVSVYRDFEDEECPDVNTHEVSQLQCQVHSNLALCQSRTNNLDGVIKNCDIVISLDPTNAKAYYRRGQAYAALKQYDIAKESFDRVIVLEPENKAARKELSAVNSHLKKSDQKLGVGLSKMFV